MAYIGARQRRQRVQYILLGLLLAAIVISAIAYFVFAAVTQEAPVNSKTLCPAKGPLGHVVVLVDKSEPLSFTQRRDFDALYDEIVRRRVPKGYLLSIYALGDDFKDTADPVIELCNPGDGSDLSEWDASPKKARERFDSRFVEPVLAMSPRLVTNKQGKASPILEMIQLVGITGFRKHAVGGERRLIIVSDLIHNTPQLSMYKGIPDYEAFAQTPYGLKAAADLKGVAVELQVFLHMPQVQKPELLEFWNQHFARANGKIVVYNPIKG